MLFQMDNIVKNNKNTCLLAFLSLLTMREVFEEVKLWFLLVGCTHENIDKCFGYWSNKLREQNNYILANLMKAFMVLWKWPFIPELIQKNQDFKTWVFGCLKDGPKSLVRHINMHLFRFFVDSSTIRLAYDAI